MKRCNNCGKSNPDDATICCYCATKFDAYQQFQNEQDRTHMNFGGQQENPYGQSHQWANFNADEYYYRNNAFDSDALGKSRGITALLAIFLGYFGVQYFYLGKVSAGIITILLSLVTCGVWSFLMFVQGIVLLCYDNYTFDKKFVYSDSTLPVF